MLCLMLTVLAHLFPAAGAGEHERTFLAVKPDGVQRRLVGEIVRRFERKGFKLVALKLVQVRALAGRAGGRGPRRARPGPTRSPPRPHPGPAGLGQAAARALRRAARAPLLRPPGGLHALGARGGHAAAGLTRLPLQERDPRQRLRGERPARDRALVPRRGAAVLGGQRPTLAARVARGPRAPPVQTPSIWAAFPWTIKQ
ncbi:nucleoside diphosphate kinase 3 isoform X1 [Vulpes lagopus]|uniref:nucleoside diphosphate kinase 3 isoform X1 n=1 Tax=Vulpes lagopus TaxID=494514 RepID=UPI001BC9DDF4|nr:nucleoside diphosphate kinase 3 isoform X1 [Vulpes lagopus]